MSAEGLARLCASLNAPMVVITAFDGRERSGCLAGFHTQCSIDPQRWLACISNANHTAGVAAGSEWLAVHFLRNDQHALAELFGGVTGDAIAPHEKFEACAWRPGPGGVPLLAGCDRITGRVLSRVDVGDHVAHLLDVVEIVMEHAPAPQLGSRDVGDIQPGHPA